MAAVDLYLVAGQSNAEGRGDSSLSPGVVPGQGYKVVGSTVSHLADPVGGADTGSAWPAFANELHRRNGGVPVAIVEAAGSGQALLAAADSGNGNWSSTGALTGSAITATSNALSALTTAGHTPTLRGFLWHQGERDAQGLSAATIASDYEAELSSLVDRLQAGLSVSVPMYVARVGAPSTGDTAAFAAVRAAQDSAATNDADIVMAYTDCVNFPANGWMSDTLHYSQTGYDAMGAGMASTIGGPLPVTTTPKASMLALPAILNQQPSVSSFNPITQVSALHAAWAEDPSWTNPGDGNAVSSWRDGGSNGTDFTNTGSARPLFRSSTAALNSKPTIQFDGTDDYLRGSNPAQAQPYKIIVVWQYVSVTSGRIVGTAGGAGGINTQGAAWRINAGVSLSGGTPNTSPHVMRATFDGASSQFWLDGTSVMSGNAGTNQIVTPQLTLGASGDATPSTFGTGHMAFVGVYTGATSDVALAALAADLKTHYGI